MLYSELRPRISRVHDLTVIVLSQLSDDSSHSSSHCLTLKRLGGQKDALLPIVQEGTKLTFVERKGD